MTNYKRWATRKAYDIVMPVLKGIASPEIQLLLADKVAAAFKDERINTLIMVRALCSNTTLAALIEVIDKQITIEMNGEL